MRPLWDVSTRANAHREYTRKSVLTMELEDSLIRISDADKLREAGLDPLRVGAAALARAFCVLDCATLKTVRARFSL